MNYDAIILELLTRIKNLELQVKLLYDMKDQSLEQEAPIDRVKKIGTKDIRNYIEDMKKRKLESNEAFLILKANDIHRTLNLKNRMPLVCNAMKQCMNSGDEILHETPSGYSSTLEIKYYLKGSDLCDR